jgi:hypothetical protein
MSQDSKKEEVLAKEVSKLREEMDKMEKRMKFIENLNKRLIRALKREDILSSNKCAPRDEYSFE